MATASGRSTTALKPAPAAPDPAEMTVEQRLFAAGPTFNFFQAVRLLEKVYPDRQPVGYDGPAGREIARFAAHVSHNFPPSQIYDIRPNRTGRLPPVMSVAFFGLTGPSGVLPRHYTELLMRIQRDAKHGEKQALRDWFDLFTHRMLSLFFRAWEKYRFYIPYERGQRVEHPPDPFTHCLLSLSGLGMGSLRNRIRVSTRGLSPFLAGTIAPMVAEKKGTVPLAPEIASDRSEADSHDQPLARVEDVAILHYAGLLARRPRTAAGLRAILADYFQVPVEVRQFHGQWLQLEPQDQSQLGCETGNCALGHDMVIGERIWDVEGQIRIRLGPLDYDQFIEFLPYRAAVSESKAFFLLSHLTRFVIGPTLDFDVQLLLEPTSVPDCILGDEAGPGCRLGWNTWLQADRRTTSVEDAVFAGQEVFRLEAAGMN